MDISKEGNIIVLGALEIAPIICFVVCFHNLWKWYIQDHCERSTAVIEKYIKKVWGVSYTGIWHKAICTLTLHGECFRKKMYFFTTPEINNIIEKESDLVGYEVTVCISFSKHGKMRVFQEGSKWNLVALAVAYGTLGLMFEVPIILALSTVLGS